MIYFDIETKPLPVEQCLPFMPKFEAPGNYKDPAVIAKNPASNHSFRVPE